MEESEAKKTPIKWIVVGVVIGIVVVTSTVILLRVLANLPKPEITSKSGEGLGNGYYVIVTVRNNGGDGYIIVSAEVSGGEELQKQDRRIYLARGESLTLTFMFYRDLPFGDMNYRVWARADWRQWA